MAGDCDTVSRNLTLLLVYSWPLCPICQFCHTCTLRVQKEGCHEHRLLYRPAETRASRSRLCASALRRLRRIVHILVDLSRAQDKDCFLSFMHVRTSSEERVTSKDDTLVSVLEEEANAVLRMAGRMKRLCGDTLANLEHLTVGRCLGDRLAVFASYHLQFAELFELYQLNQQVCEVCITRDRWAITYNLIVTTSMIPVAVTDSQSIK